MTLDFPIRAAGGVENGSDHGPDEKVIGLVLVIAVPATVLAPILLPRSNDIPDPNDVQALVERRSLTPQFV